MKCFITLTASHLIFLVIGFMAGVYTLPILTAPPAPATEVLAKKAASAMFSGEFTRDLRGSDRLHWGEGTVSLTQNEIVFTGKLAPGPDYKLYLVNTFVEHEDEFLPLKENAQLIGDIKSFDGFILDLPQGVDLTANTTVVIWCEAFSEFITAAQYR